MKAQDWVSLLWIVGLAGGFIFALYFFTKRAFDQNGLKGVWEHLRESLVDLLAELH